MFMTNCQPVPQQLFVCACVRAFMYLYGVRDCCASNETTILNKHLQGINAHLYHHHPHCWDTVSLDLTEHKHIFC